MGKEWQNRVDPPKPTASQFFAEAMQAAYGALPNDIIKELHGGLLSHDARGRRIVVEADPPTRTETLASLEAYVMDRVFAAKSPELYSDGATDLAPLTKMIATWQLEDELDEGMHEKRPGETDEDHDKRLEDIGKSYSDMAKKDIETAVEKYIEQNIAPDRGRS
jgi:hypothetical protein